MTHSTQVPRAPGLVAVVPYRGPEVKKDDAPPGAAVCLSYCGPWVGPALAAVSCAHPAVSSCPAVPLEAQAAWSNMIPPWSNSVPP